ncbi:HIT family protein [Lactiplantibacillus fabifermentans]|uniref:HIT domain-containing protein n=2 Tax=Lactiplantibacillus fabifermentans TaxID=483011 RepID=A0A0R2NNR7_9LACO|nr:DeoR family transcriptional regulator [Lactiplantibacillus fabifermentans T30PCM01]KRO26482.1 hypothetical protein DY78_GL000906 [Lactiplantibacillus fabifermentans DSM 21115]
MVMATLPGGVAVFGDVQFLPGYSVLLPRREVASLNELTLPERTLFLRDMSILGDAIQVATSAQRINYDILGNTDAFLHAHVFPRYATESPTHLAKSVWLYSPDHWTAAKYAYDAQRDQQLRQTITTYLSNYTEE